MFYEGEAAPEHALLRYGAVRSVTSLAKAPFNPGCWFWLGVLVLQRIVLGIIQAMVFLTATSRAMWAAVTCCVFFGMQVAFHPFKEPTHNAAQTMLLFCASMVSALNVVPAAMSTNAMSTSHTMENETIFLVAVEAALLFVPICVVAAWQAYEYRNDARKALTSATGAVRSIARLGWEGISNACTCCVTHVLGCFERSAQPTTPQLDSLNKSLLAEGGDGRLVESDLLLESAMADESRTTPPTAPDDYAG